MVKLSQYATGDSASLKHLDGKEFSIVGVEDSDYDNQPGVKITVQGEYEIDGNKFSKFHTTRTAIVNQLKNPKLREELSDLNPLKVKMKEQPNKAGKPYFVLEDVE